MGTEYWEMRCIKILLFIFNLTFWVSAGAAAPAAGGSGRWRMRGANPWPRGRARQAGARGPVGAAAPGLPRGGAELGGCGAELGGCGSELGGAEPSSGGARVPRSCGPGQAGPRAAVPPGQRSGSNSLFGTALPGEIHTWCKVALLKRQCLLKLMI